jgi:MoaA/NifB/PqqE/SkfB family radical SAM enzyme
VSSPVTVSGETVNLLSCGLRGSNPWAPTNTWSQSVHGRTSACHAERRGSLPLGTAKFYRIKSQWRLNMLIMYTDPKTIKKIELELSSYCNASCPLCSRNFYGYNFKNPSFGLRHLSLSDIKKILDASILSGVETIVLQGNFGDLCMNPETPEIVNYILSINPDIKISGHTNGSAQATDWWVQLNRVRMYFALDGKDQETHQKYRKDTNFKKIIQNATALKNAGGEVVWKMLIFDHNQYQVDDCRKMAKDLGFKFTAQQNTKSSGPVFDQKKIHLHNIGNWKGSKKIDEIINQELLLEDLNANESPVGSIDCLHLREKSIFISSWGEIFPCCFLAHAAGRWDHGRWIKPYNNQLLPLIQDHNSLEHGIEQASKWFDRIPETWELPTYKMGRLLYCDSNCSKK